MNNFTSLIAGSTGFLGSKILNALNQEDNKIYCLSRRDNNHSSSNIEQIIIKVANNAYIFYFFFKSFINLIWSAKKLLFFGYLKLKFL